MLKIRLSQFGKKNAHTYRIIVKEARSKRQGDYVDLIGYYSPLAGQAQLNINQAKLKDWQYKGAQLTPAVAALIEKANSQPKNAKAQKTA